MPGFPKTRGKRGRLQAASLVLLTTTVLSIPQAGVLAQGQGGTPGKHTAVASKELFFVSDGMRHDLAEKYAKAGDMPNYAKIFSSGVTGDNGMVPQFPPNTGAGWSSITTGAWSGNHGGLNNTFHIDSNGIYTATSGYSTSILQAETYGEVVEKAGKKVAIMDWPGTLPGTKIKGPAVDFRNFYSSRGVVANYEVPGVLPNFVKDFGLVYTSGLKLADASSDWQGVPATFSPAKETSFSFQSYVISGTAASFLFNVYISDSTNDNAVNYDKVLITRDTKTAANTIADLKVGDWKDVKLNLPQNNLLVGTYMKLIDLNADASKLRIYFSSLSRTRSNMPDLEQKIAADFPSATGADFAPLEAGIIDAQTYVEQGLKWYDMYSKVHDYVIGTYNPDVVMAGYPDTDEFSHQFLSLADPKYTGPRPSYGNDPAKMEGYIKSAYVEADQILGHLWELMGGADKVVTFVGADHGFSAASRSVNMIQVLQDAGLYDAANKANTKANGYVAGATANIYINLKDRETGGIVAQADYEATRTQIINAFNGLTENGAKVAAAVWKKEETRTIQADGYTINGWNPTRTGDVVVVLKPPYQFDAPTAGKIIADSPFYGQHGYLPDAVDLANNTNMHAMFGIYGPGIAKGKKIGKPRTVDIAPTAAYALNISPPRFADGRVLTEAFSDTPATLVPITVLAWGDYHGQLDPVQASVDKLNVPSGGVANIGAYWNEVKAKNPNGTLIFSDGDNVGATPPNSAFLGDEPTINAMNMIGFTASATGNHEFDKGVAGFTKISTLAKFPYLADNIVEASTGKLAPFARPYIITKANGIDVGIIGIANPETPNVTSPKGIMGYNWVNPIAPTNAYVKELAGKGIKTIIVLYHQGSTKGGFDDVDGLFGDLAKNLDPEVDLLVGGHTRVKTMTRINGMLVSAANHALETSEMTLLVDPATKDVVWSWGAFRRPYGGAITPEPALATLVKSANDQIKPTLGEQVGTVAALVDRSRGAESKMGNLISDAIRATYGVDVALQNSGGLRADLNAGPATRGDVFAVLPFGNIVVTGNLKGSDLLAALENGVSDVSGSAGRFIQLSGVRFAYDPAKPVGSRVLWAVLSDGKPLDPNATYKVAANDFMTVGGDGYTSLTKIANPVTREQLYEVAVNYVKSTGTIDPKVEGRIIAAQAGQPAPTPPTEATPVLATPASSLPTAAPTTPAAQLSPTGVTGATTVTSAPVQPTSTEVVASPTVASSPVPVPGMPTTGGGNDNTMIIVALTGAALALLAGLLVSLRKAAR